MKITIDTERMSDDQIDRLIIKIDKAVLDRRIRREVERQGHNRFKPKTLSQPATLRKR